jgi:hypothetical protein
MFLKSRYFQNSLKFRLSLNYLRCHYCLKTQMFQNYHYFPLVPELPEEPLLKSH